MVNFFKYFFKIILFIVIKEINQIIIYFKTMSQDIKNIICIGAGYVGSITMTIFANYHREINFYVYDVYKKLIDKWNAVTDEKSLPIVEPSLYEYFRKVWKQNLFFTDNLSDEIIRNSDVI